MAKHFAHAVPGEPEGRGTTPGEATTGHGAVDPASTAAFMEALSSSRERQRTRATYTRSDEAAERARRIREDVMDPAAPALRIPVAPSAPAPSPYIEPILPPDQRPRERLSADTTGVFLAAYEQGTGQWHPRERPVGGGAHFRRGAAAVEAPARAEDAPRARHDLLGVEEGFEPTVQTYGPEGGEEPVRPPLLSHDHGTDRLAHPAHLGAGSWGETDDNASSDIDETGSGATEDLPTTDTVEAMTGCEDGTQAIATAVIDGDGTVDAPVDLTFPDESDLTVDLTGESDEPDAALDEPDEPTAALDEPYTALDEPVTAPVETDVAPAAASDATLVEPDTAPDEPVAIPGDGVGDLHAVVEPGGWVAITAADATTVIGGHHGAPLDVAARDHVGHTVVLGPEGREAAQTSAGLAAEVVAADGTRGSTADLDEEIARTQGAAPALDGQEPGEVEPTGLFEGASARTSVAEAVDETDGIASDEAVGRSAAMMSVLVIVSRITGFLRTWGQGAAIGGAMLASCYTVANNLPNQLYELVMGGMLVTAFLPVYLAVRKEGGRERSNAYASNLLSIVVLVMGAVAVLGIVFASQVVYTQSFNATSEFDHGLATYFFRFFAIEVVLYGLSSVFSGVLNAERDYFWSTAAPIFNNIICTLSFLLYALLVNVDQSLAVLILAIGNPLGVAIQVIMQVPSLRRLGVRLRLHIDWHDPALRDTLAIGIPSILVMVVSFVTVSVQTSCVLSATASGAAVAYYSRLWYTLPYAILAIPVTTAMFTELSQAFAHDDMDAFGRGVSRGVERIMFFLVPFGLFLIVFATQLASLLNAGAFTAEELSMIAGYLQALALSLPFYGVCTYLQKVCSSLRRMRLFAISNIVAGAFQVVFCLVLTPILGYVVPALSSLFFFVLMDLVTFVQLRRELGPIGFRAMALCGLRSLGLGLAGSAVGALILWVLTGPVGFQGTGFVHGLVLCVAGGIPALLVTFGGALLLKVPEASFLRTLVGRLGRAA